MLALFRAAEIVVDLAGTLEVNECEGGDCTLNLGRGQRWNKSMQMNSGPKSIRLAN